MKVRVPDAERGFVLAGQLARYSAQVVENGKAGSYEVTLDDPSNDELSVVLAAIERWVGDEHVGAARVELEGRSYLMERQATS
jgi:hypothetical protein